MPDALSHRKFDYCSVIISLYGLFERFMEDSISLTVKEFTKIAASYSDMPDDIRKNNLIFTLEFLLNKYNNAHTENSAVIIESLHKCLSGQPDFSVLDKAFYSHNTNFWMKSIKKSLSDSGIKNIEDKLLRTPSMQDYLIYKYPDLDTKGAKDQFKEIFDYVDELASRRNEVAHGNASDIIRIEDISNDWILFFQYFAFSIFEVIRSEIINHTLTMSGFACGPPIKVYRRNIVCFDPIASSFGLGDILVARSGEENQPTTASTISSIQINSLNKDFITQKNTEAFALKAGVGYSRNQEFFILKEGTLSDWIIG